MAKFAPGNPGRPKGSKNKTPLAVKKAVYEAFEKAGGAAYLADLAQKDPRTFVTLLTKLIPSEVEAKVTSMEMTKEQRDAIIAAAHRADE